MSYKPVPVPSKNIGSIDVTKVDAGQYLLGAQNGPKNSFISSKDIELTIDGYMKPRRHLTRFLPDTVEDTYQKYPVLWEGELYHFTADDGKIKYCQEGDTEWTDCTGDNTITTGQGGFPKFLRILDNVMMLNGENGDRLCFVDLSTAGWPVVKYTAVADPTVALTTTLTNLTAGPGSIYYAYTYSGAVGETALAPITTQSINLARDQWAGQTLPGSIKLTRPAGPAPAGAQFWNIYLALAATAGTIQDSDMLQLAVKLDLNNADFVDDGVLDINLSSVPPAANSTEGPRVSHGSIEDGNPILYGDVDAPYNIWIGGGGPNAMDFSVSNGGYRAEPEKGTNYYPTNVIGFRNGQGIPSMTVLYSNTEGISKQAVLQQQTVNYGDQSFTIWGVTEQHYGAAGVAAPNSAINYNGKLLFLSTDGIASMETQPSIQNVLSTKSISSPIDPYIRSIRNSAMGTVVGAAWNNKYMWIVPNGGFDTPQEILVLDTNNKGVNGDGAWYTLQIPAQWMGVTSPDDNAAFVYICQGKSTYKLLDSTSTFDVKGGISVPFSTEATGPWIPMGNAEAHNRWQAGVQVQYYVVGLVGTMTIGVRYRNQNGRTKTKTKVINGNTFIPSAAGGWGDPQWTYAAFPALLGWGAFPQIDDSTSNVQGVDKRKPVRPDDVFNEAQWFYSTPVGYNDFLIRAISFEGIDLGVKPDLQ